MHGKTQSLDRMTSTHLRRDARGITKELAAACRRTQCGRLRGKAERPNAASVRELALDLKGVDGLLGTGVETLVRSGDKTIPGSERGIARAIDGGPIGMFSKQAEASGDKDLRARTQECAAPRMREASAAKIAHCPLKAVARTIPPHTLPEKWGRTHFGMGLGGFLDAQERARSVAA